MKEAFGTDEEEEESEEIPYIQPESKSKPKRKSIKRIEVLKSHRTIDAYKKASKEAAVRNVSNLMSPTSVETLLKTREETAIQTEERRKKSSENTRKKVKEALVPKPKMKTKTLTAEEVAQQKAARKSVEEQAASKIPSKQK